eukprot:379960-Karenia_brevis.AAC.1
MGGPRYEGWGAPNGAGEEQAPRVQHHWTPAVGSNNAVLRRPPLCKGDGPCSRHGPGLAQRAITLTR